jgi:hypothetical protein
VSTVLSAGTFSPHDLRKLVSCPVRGLDPDTLRLGAPSVERCADLWSCDSAAAAEEIRARLQPYRGQIAPLNSTKVGPAARYYGCDEVTFRASDDNQVLVRVYVDDQVALARGFGTRLSPHSALTANALRRFRQLAGCSQDTAVRRLREMTRAAADGAPTPVTEGRDGPVRRYVVDDFALVTPPAHGVIVDVNLVRTLPLHELEKAPAVPLVPDSVVVPVNRLDSVYPDGCRDSGAYGRGLVWRLLAPHADGYGTVTVSGTRVYDCGEWQVGLSPSNRALLWLDPTTPRPLDLSRAQVSSWARRNTAMICKVSDDQVEQRLRDVMADRDGTLPDDIHVGSVSGRASGRYDLSLPDGTRLIVRVRLNGRVIKNVLPAMNQDT